MKIRPKSSLTTSSFLLPTVPCVLQFFLMRRDWGRVRWRTVLLISKKPECHKISVVMFVYYMATIVRALWLAAERALLETLSTTTGATTTAYRKQIFCSCHAQKLNNWLQSTVVFTLATPHLLFWRSVDNVAVYCKVFSPFFDLPFFFLRHIMKDLSGVYCQTFFEEKFYDEHPWGRKIR